MTYNESLKIPTFSIKESVVPPTIKYTIAIPTYKRADLLKEAIDSCLAQKTNIPFVIMIVDNNPERDCKTEQLMQGYTMSNILYYKNSENIGIAGNWNKLFQLTTTDFVIMLHDDDLLYDDYIDKLDKILKYYNYDVNALYFGVKVFNNAQELPIKTTGRLKALTLKKSDFQFGNICNLVGAVFKRSVVIETNGFNPDYGPSLDYEMHVRLAEKGKSIKIYGYDTLYRISENESMNGVSILKMCNIDKEIITKVTESFPKFYKEYFLKYYLKSYDKNYIEWNKELYNTPDNQVDEYLHRKELEATLFDKIVFKIGSYLRNHLLSMFRKKSIKIEL